MALDEVAADLERLAVVAGLESWWLTADLADACGVDAWRHLAEERAASVARAAGPRADAFRRAAATHLNRRGR